MAKIFNPFDDGCTVQLSQFEFMQVKNAVREDLERLEREKAFALELNRQHLADEVSMRLDLLKSAQARLLFAMQQVEDGLGSATYQRITPAVGPERLSAEAEDKARVAAVGTIIQYYADHGSMALAPRPPKEVLEAVRKGLAKLEPEGKC